jgi:hypothetical protein
MKVKTIKKEEPTSVNNILVVMVIIVVVVALFNLIMTFTKVSDFNKQLTGYATTASGYVNITVNTSMSITVMPAGIHWGEGSVNASQTNAVLSTGGNTSKVVRGSWSSDNVTGLVLKNVGNTNCSINLTFLMNRTEFFGASSDASKNYSFNFSNREVGSCDGVGGLKLNSWHEANKTHNASTSWPWLICKKFSSVEANNEMWIDVNLTVPYDTNNTNIMVGDILTFTASNPL